MFTNILFYISWGVLVVIPLFIAIIAPPSFMKKIIAALGVLVITLGLTVLIFQNCQNENKIWNNGICECGGFYRLSAASNYRTSKHFYYTCDSCGHTEEFSKIMK